MSGEEANLENPVQAGFASVGTGVGASSHSREGCGFIGKVS